MDQDTVFSLVELHLGDGIEMTFQGDSSWFPLRSARSAL